VALGLVKQRKLPETRTAIALQPGLGETGLFLEPGCPPAISLPARAEAALALIFAFVRPLIDRLTGREEPRVALTLPIDRKIAVSAGVSNVILLAREANCWRVIASGDLPLSAFARADALAVLGPECEGLAPGALVKAHLLTDTP
jgi:molybdopterin biosynthesis enzyme